MSTAGSIARPGVAHIPVDRAIDILAREGASSHAAGRTAAEASPKSQRVLHPL